MRQIARGAVVEKTIKQWMEEDEHGFNHSNPIYNFYYKVLYSRIESSLNVSWTYASNREDNLNLYDLNVHPMYTILTSNGMWKMISRGTIRRIDFAIKQLKRAREIGSAWKKERYYWNEKSNVPKSSNETF